MKQHRLLILGSQMEFVELVRQSKERGYYTVVCDGYHGSPAKKIADKAYDIDVRQVDAIVDMCREEKIDGIMGSFSDLLFEQITKIADQAGLKWYVKPEMLPYYREKDAAKKLLREIGVCVPKSITLEQDFSEQELEGMQYPLVVKPINGYGSKGIFVVHSLEEIREQFLEITKRSTFEKVQVEEYSKGREYNMMTWLVDGVVQVISIADREKNPQKGNTVPTLNRIVYPAKNIENILEEAKMVLQRFADKTGQKEGALSMQFFYNDQGVEVCEIAGRLFGYEHELVTYGSGLDIEKLLLDYVYDGETLQKTLKEHSPYFKTCCAGLYFLGIQGEKIKNQDSLYELAKDSHVVESICYYKEGEEIDNYGPASYLARYYLQAETRREIDAVTELFFREAHVYTEEGTDLVYPFILSTME